VAEDELKKKFGSIDVRVVEYQPGGLKNLQGERRQLWPLLLGFLLAVLTLEMLMANGILRFKR